MGVRSDRTGETAEKLINCIFIEKVALHIIEPRLKEGINHRGAAPPLRKTTMTIEQQIKAAVAIILNSEPNSPEAIRAGYDVVALRHKQDNPSAYLKGAE
jgi:hypothetical protein